jgi:hypothetical protein
MASRGETLGGAGNTSVTWPAASLHEPDPSYEPPWSYEPDPAYMSPPSRGPSAAPSQIPQPARLAPPPPLPNFQVQVPRQPQGGMPSFSQSLGGQQSDLAALAAQANNLMTSGDATQQQLGVMLQQIVEALLYGYEPNMSALSMLAQQWQQAGGI